MSVDPVDPHERRIVELAAELRAAGVERVHVLGWRDLDDPDAGGSELHADEFMRRWAAAGLDVTHRTSAARGLPDDVARNGYRVIRRGSRYSVFPRAMASELTGRMGRADALVEIWNGVPWFSPVWFHQPRVVMLHHVHGPMWEQMLPRPFAGAGRLLEARIAPPFYRRTALVTPSEATRDELLTLGLRPDRVTAVNNGVDPSFHPGTCDVTSPTPLVVAVGRFAPVKRFELLIDALLEARRGVGNLDALLVGDGPLRGELEARVAAAGAAEWIRFAGRVDHGALVDVYRKAWVVASASLAEGWGLTLTEAAACGTPAVATDIPGHRCSVVDGVTGVLAPPAALGAALTDVLTHHERRRSLAVAARSRAATLTWSASAAGLLTVLAGEVRRAGAPAST